jgi:hypothetical protein
MIEVKITGESWAEVAGQIAGIAGAVSAPVATAPAKAAEPEPAPATTQAREEEAKAGADEPRTYGSASEGRARRTKAEIAVDQQIEHWAKKLGIEKIPTDSPADVVLKEMEQAYTQAGEISEAAEPVEEPESDVLTGEVVEERTADDVRDAMKVYMEKYGMEALQKNGPKLLGAPKLSAVTDYTAAYNNLMGAVNG